MRSLFIFCLAVVAGGPFVIAQQRDESQRFEPDLVPDDFGIEQGIDRPNPPLHAGDIAPDELPVPTADSAIASMNKWKPQYRVVLKLTRNGQSIVSTETYVVPRTIMEHREVTREGRNGSVKQVVAEMNTVMEQRQRQVVSPGTAVLVCDSINVAMKSLEDGKGEGFTFETTGRTRLMLGSYTLDCDALAFADGVLSLKSTKSAQGVFKMQASDMKFELNVFGVDSSRFDQFVESLVPEQSAIANPPGDPFEPRRRDFTQDDGNWLPEAREPGFDRRGTDDDATGEFSRGRNKPDFGGPVPDPRQRSEARDEDLAQ